MSGLGGTPVFRGRKDVKPVTGSVPAVGRPEWVPQTDAQREAVEQVRKALAALRRAEAAAQRAELALWEQVKAARELDVADRAIERLGVSRASMNRKVGTRES